MSLLILGATGFLGPHLVAAGVQQRKHVNAAARAPHESPQLGLLPPSALHCWDGTHPAATERLLDSLQPSGVLLAAALSRVAACERDPALARQLNAVLPERVARACAARGVRLVFLSTDLVFGAQPPRQERYAEDDPPGPLHVYGRSKAEGEERVLAADGRALVVRLPLLFGASGGRGLGATDQILAALARGETPALFQDEWRTPLEASNAARALLELLAGTTHGLLHVAGPERLSRFEFGLQLLASQGASPEEARARLRATLRAAAGHGQRPADVSLDATRARALLATTLLAPREALRAAHPVRGGEPGT